MFCRLPQELYSIQINTYRYQIQVSFDSIGLGTLSGPTFQVSKNIRAADNALSPVLKIRDILVRIRIPRSVPLTNGSGSGFGSGSGSNSGSDSFLHLV
jgi:hypothetical protein